ncbi:MAG TPA: WYL domain-containing protein [Sporichthyaceae bacterium]|nr:WYL domain-containing protein [Sporichthyaceae bacterium]
MTTAADRLTRLLALVPYLLNRPGIPLATAARDAGISEAQLVKDLELLFVCGLPGHLPDDLIEAEWESGQVFLGNADTIGRPLRLGVDEVAALSIGLRLLAALPGISDRGALDKAIAKLQEVAGSVAGDVADRLEITTDDETPESVLADARRGLAANRRLHLRYWVPWRDEATERDVDPMRLAVVDGRTYLEGWCHRAEDVRLFRLDRVLALRVLDEVVSAPRVPIRDLDGGLFRASPDDTVATVRLAPEARWVAEYYPCDEVTELPDGSAIVRLRTAGPDWIVRLALRLGPSAAVIDPPHIADTVRERALATLERYGGTQEAGDEHH